MIGTLRKRHSDRFSLLFVATMEEITNMIKTTSAQLDAQERDKESVQDGGVVVESGRSSASNSIVGTKITATVIDFVQETPKEIVTLCEVMTNIISEIIASTTPISENIGQVQMRAFGGKCVVVAVELKKSMVMNGRSFDMFTLTGQSNMLSIRAYQKNSKGAYTRIDFDNSQLSDLLTSLRLDSLIQKTTGNYVIHDATINEQPARQYFVKSVLKIGNEENGAEIAGDGKIITYKGKFCANGEDEDPIISVIHSASASISGQRKGTKNVTVQNRFGGKIGKPKIVDNPETRVDQTRYTHISEEDFTRIVSNGSTFSNLISKSLQWNGMTILQLGARSVYRLMHFIEDKATRDGTIRVIYFWIDTYPNLMFSAKETSVLNDERRTTGAHRVVVNGSLPIDTRDGKLYHYFRCIYCSTPRAMNVRACSSCYNAIKSSKPANSVSSVNK